ncbi:MAG: amidohydrolase [Candidatus Aerophobus sp.]|nr:MAG: amidohydrolase [Candidatus Aerophobus sp.]
MKGTSIGEVTHEISKVAVVDTHEHLFPEGWTSKKGPDYSVNYHVIIRERKEDEEVNLSSLLNNSYCTFGGEVVSEDWDSLGRFINKMRGRAFYRCLFRALQELYDFHSSDIDEDNWRELSRRISVANNQKGWQKKILKDRANIDLIIWDPYWEMGSIQVDRKILRPIFRIDPFLIGCNASIESHDGVSPHSYAEKLKFGIQTFDDYLDFIAFAIEKNKREGAVGVKCAIAYERSLDFQSVEKTEAQKIFGLSDDRLSDKAKKLFGDYIMHFIVQRAAQHNLPIQIHTGLGGLEGSNPMNLINLIARYPEARFVLFHGGYPWTSQISAIAFTYLNVYLDLVWLPIISPEVAVRILHEWIEVVGADRLTWGGDCCTAEEAYGALLTAREVVGRVLTDKIERGFLTQEAASDIAWKIFRDNALELYNLS